MTTLRKRVRHYDQQGHSHELTFSCYRRMPLLEDDERRRGLSLSIDRAVVRHGFRLLAFVYMPEHVHLLVFGESAEARVSSLLYAIKRPFSYRVKQQLERTASPLLEKLTIRERPGKQSFRFWQEGPGYDRNLRTAVAVRAAVDYIHHNPVRRGLCDSPELWRWSSWEQVHQPGQSCDPDLPKVLGLAI